MALTMEINSVTDLVKVKNALIQEKKDIKISKVSNLEYVIKLQGGRFDNYDLLYIDADIAKIILAYQTQYDKFLDALEKQFSIQIPQSERMLKFKIDKGCIQISAEFGKEFFIKALENMSGQETMFAFIVIILSWFSKEAFNKYMEKEMKYNDNQVTNNAINALKEFALNRDLQNPTDKFKRNMASILQNNEEALLNPDLQEENLIPIKNSDKHKYKATPSKIEDIEEEVVIDDYIEAQNFVKTGKPFKLQKLGIKANSMIIDGKKRMDIIKKAENKQLIKFKLKLIKDGTTKAIKEAYIIDVLD